MAAAPSEPAAGTAIVAAPAAPPARREIPHRGLVSIVDGENGRQFVCHEGTGEKQWLPVCATAAGWSLMLDAEGYGAISSPGMEPLWLSGINPILKQRLFSSRAGRLFHLLRRRPTRVAGRGTA